MLETSNFVHGLAMHSLSLVMCECSLSGHVQGHVSNFYIVDLENFATATLYTYRWYTQLDRRRFVYDTYKTMKATRTHHSWVHMFITHRPTSLILILNCDFCAFSDLTLLVGGQERHPACKKTEWWDAGVVICLERGADLIRPSWCHCHSLTPASVKSRLVLPFWYRLTQVVLEKGR